MPLPPATSDVIIPNNNDAITRNRIKTLIYSIPELRPKGKYKIREVKMVEPDYELYDGPAPYCFIRIPHSFQYTRETTGTGQNSLYQQLARFEIGIVVHGADIEKAQEQLQPRVTLIGNMLKNNSKLKKPNGLDPILTRSFTKVDRLFSKQGMEIDGVVISLDVTYGANWYATIGGVTFPLLSKPLESPLINRDVNLDTAANRFFSLMDKAGEIHLEYERDPAVFDIVQDLIDDGCDITITLITGGVPREWVVFMEKQQATAQFDQIDRVVISMSLVR